MNFGVDLHAGEKFGSFLNPAGRARPDETGHWQEVISIWSSADSSPVQIPEQGKSGRKGRPLVLRRLERRGVDPAPMLNAFALGDVGRLETLAGQAVFRPASVRATAPRPL